MRDVDTPGKSESAVTRQNGAARPEHAEARSCAVCGTGVSGRAIERFGEVLCSAGHGEEFAKAVRAARIQAAAAALSAQEPSTESAPLPAPPEAPQRRGWKRYLKMAACCGAPLLALAFLAGGGGALLGAAGAALPFLAALACPVGMYFMMRAMTKREHTGEPHDTDMEKQSRGRGNER